MSEGDISTFFMRPISGVIMAAVIVIILWPLLSRFLFKPVLKRLGA